MQQPQGFIKPGENHLVCKLHNFFMVYDKTPESGETQLHLVLIQPSIKC